MENLFTGFKRSHTIWYEDEWKRRGYGELANLGAPISLDALRMMADLELLADCAGLSMEILPSNASRSIEAGGGLHLCPSVILHAEVPFQVAEMVVSNANEYRATPEEAQDLGELVFKQFCAAFEETSVDLEDPEQLIKLVDKSAKSRRVLQSQWGKLLHLAVNVEAAGGKARYLPKTVEFSFTAFGSSAAKFNPLQLQEAKNWLSIYLPASRRQGFRCYLTREERRALKKRGKAVSLAG